MTTKQEATLIAQLRPRERDVLVLIAEGYSVPEIAERRAWSRKTVDYVKSRLMNKLDLHDRVALARFAIRHGLVSVDADVGPSRLARGRTLMMSSGRPPDAGLSPDH